VIEEEIIEHAQLDGTRQAQRLHQDAQLSAKADILHVKQEELETTEQNVVQVIMAWDAPKTKALLEALMGLLPDEGGSVTAGDVHKEQVGSLAKLRGLTVQDDIVATDGGFVYHSKRTELDLTVRHLVRRLFISRQKTINSL